MSTFEKWFWIAVKVSVFGIYLLLMFGGGTCGLSYLSATADVFAWMGIGLSLAFIAFMGSFAIKAGKAIFKNDVPPYGISLFGVWILLMLGCGFGGLLLIAVGARQGSTGFKMLAVTLLAMLITYWARNKRNSAAPNAKTQDKEQT